MDGVYPHIPLVVDVNMNFVYQPYDPDNISIMLEDKIRESIIYLLTWFNEHVLIRPQTGHFLRERFKTDFKLDAMTNIYLFNSFQHWKIYHQELSNPIDILNNKYIQPEYIGHTDLGMDWNMNYSIFTYPKVVNSKMNNQPPQRDETGKIIFYCKIGDRMIPVDAIDDIQYMFPGMRGSPIPRVNSLNDI